MLLKFCEVVAVKTRDWRRVQGIDMKFSRYVKGYDEIHRIRRADMK